MSRLKILYFRFLNLIAILIYFCFFNKYSRTTYSYLSNRVASLILEKSFKASGKISAKFPLIISGLENVEVGDGFKAEKNLKIEVFNYRKGQAFSPKVIIGSNVSINENFHLGCVEEVIIGNNVLIASNVYISDHAHGSFSSTDLLLPPVERPLITKGPVHIGDNVWVGEGVSILPGVKIGENSIIGANSVVTKAVPKNVVVVGAPAKVIKSID